MYNIGAKLPVSLVDSLTEEQAVGQDMAKGRYFRSP